MSDASAELVDVVDDDDEVVGQARRAEVRSQRLLHRAVFVALTTGDGDVWVHQRAPWKDLWPSRWDVAFGGVVGAGESYRTAAQRELAEEAGVDVPELVGLGHGRFEDDDVRELAWVYRAHHDGPLAPADGEVVALERVPSADLAAWVASREIVPDSAALVLPHLLGAPERS